MDILSKTKQVYEQTGSQRAAARVLGISQGTVSYRLAQLRAMEEDMPHGQTLRGISTLYDQDGKLRARWVKTKPAAEDVVRYIRESFADLAPSRAVPSSGASLSSDLLTVYPVADLHLGQYSWAAETGQDYDLEVAVKVLTQTVSRLVLASPDSETAIVLNLGDFFHSDSNENRTRRSGNVLDTDTRYAKVLQTGVSLMATVVELALGKHRKVIVRNLQGNHDPYAALALAVAMEAYYRQEPRVRVDTSPSPFFFHRHGRVLIGATHGDMARAEDMPGIMAAKVPDLWGQTIFRYVYAGHLHSAKKKLVSEGSGAQVEVFQTLAPRDAWGNSMGFTSGQSMVSITHHRRHGEETRLTQNVRGPS